MPRQLDGGYQVLSTAALEERIRLLEYRVAALTEAVQELRSRCRGNRESAESPPEPVRRSMGRATV